MVLKNARLLCMVNPFKAFAVLAAVAVMVFLLAALMPLSIALLLTCAVALVQYTVCFLVNGLAEQYILTDAAPSEQ